MTSENNFADVIYKIRRVNKLTQRQFADHLGVNQATISAWELNKQYPGPNDFKTLEKIAKEFNVDFDSLKANLGVSFEDRLHSKSKIRTSDPYIVPLIERLELIYSKMNIENKYKLMLNIMNNLEALASDYIPSVTKKEPTNSDDSLEDIAKI